MSHVECFYSGMDFHSVVPRAGPGLAEISYVWKALCGVFKTS